MTTMLSQRTRSVSEGDNLSFSLADASGSLFVAYALLSAISSGSPNESTTGDYHPHTSSQELSLAREIGQLKRELAAMTRQRDILKKAISILSHDKNMSGGLS